MSDDLHANPLIAVVDEVYRLQGRFKSLFSEVQGASGLSPLRNLVLSAVLEAKVSPTVPQIGRSLGYPRQIIQRIANELIELGLLEKAPNPHHKRASLLIATPKAYQLKEKSDKTALAIAAAFLKTIDAGKCEEIAAILRDFRAELEDYTRSRNKISLDATTELSPAGALVVQESVD